MLSISHWRALSYSSIRRAYGIQLRSGRERWFPLNAAMRLTIRSSSLSLWRLSSSDTTLRVIAIQWKFSVTIITCEVLWMSRNWTVAKLDKQWNWQPTISLLSIGRARLTQPMRRLGDLITKRTRKSLSDSYRPYNRSCGERRAFCLIRNGWTQQLKRQRPCFKLSP